MTNAEFAEGISTELVTFADNRPVPVGLRVGLPEPDIRGGWRCKYEITIGPTQTSGYGPGADGLDALISTLTILAVEVDRLRAAHPMSWHGRTDGYFCLDALLGSRE
jgi:hypothetical protein